MSYKQNLHIHTTYSDGKNSPEEMILEAAKRGFDSIGFSEHSLMENSSCESKLTIDKMVDYKKDIRSLKAKYSGKIDIFCGLEFEFFSEVPVDGFDYLIGSVHYLDCDGEVVTFDSNLENTLSYIDTYFNGDGFAFAKKYFETVATLPKKHSFDIIGHFDLVTKNNEKGRFLDVENKNYLNLGFEAIHALKGKIPLFEVNTGAISRGYRTSPYPQMEFLKEFKNCGFGVLITSDCHNKDFIDCYYNEAKELIAEAGFNSKWVLTDNGFKEVSL